MNKCPYCAEKIKNEAIVCRYCGRDLPQPIADSTPSTTSQTPSGQPPIPTVKGKRSVWATGAIWAAVFTALATIGEVIRYYNSPIELFGSVVGGTIASFIFWWLICTLIAWLWRKAGNRKIIKTVIIISIILLSITLCVVVGILENPVPQLFPFATVKQISTVPNTTSSVIYFDDFSKINNNWLGESQFGTVKFSNGGYRIDEASSSEMIIGYLTKSVPNDGRIEVDATVLSGTNGNTSFGIVCRYSYSGKSLYLLGISSDGYSEIIKYLDGQQINLQTGSESIMIGKESNHLRVDCVGNELTLYVNGIKTSSVIDNSLSSGSVGLWAGGITEILFDNFYVYKP